VAEAKWVAFNSVHGLSQGNGYAKGRGYIKI